MHAGRSHFPTVRFFLQSLPLIVLFAAFAEAKSDFHEATLKEHLQRHQRQAVIFRRHGEFTNLTSVQQQFAFALAGMIVDTGLSVLGDVAVTQPDFFVVDARSFRPA